MQGSTSDHIPIQVAYLACEEYRWILEMTWDYHKLNQVMTPIPTAVQMWFCCLSKLTHSLVMLTDTQLLIWQMLFSPSLLIKATRSILLLDGKVSNTPHCPISGVYQLYSLLRADIF